MRRIAIAAAAALTTLAATLPLAAAETVTDVRGRTVEVGDRSRIVSIGGTVTEILYDLDVAQAIVAVDTTSLYPPRALAEHQNVGYMRALSAEGVLATGPTLILASEGSGPPEVVDVLANSAVPMVLVDDAPTHAAVVGRVKFLADVAGVPERGAALAAKIEAGFAKLDAVRAKIVKPARVLFVLSVRDGHPLVAGSGTAADAIITLAGGINVAAGFEGYKPMSEEAIVEAQPEAVLVMESGNHTVNADDLLDTPAFRTTPAARDKRLYVRDGLSLLGFGPRTPEVALELARTLHPDQVPVDTMPPDQVPADQVPSGATP